MVGSFSEAGQEKRQRINFSVVPARNLPPAFCEGVVRGRNEINKILKSLLQLEGHQPEH